MVCRMSTKVLLVVGLLAWAGCTTVNVDLGYHDAGESPADSDPEPTVCGDALCTAGEVCCNESCSICAPPGQACVTLNCDACGEESCASGEVCCDDCAGGFSCISGRECSQCPPPCEHDACSGLCCDCGDSLGPVCTSEDACTREVCGFTSCGDREVCSPSQECCEVCPGRFTCISEGSCISRVSAEGCAPLSCDGTDPRVPTVCTSFTAPGPRFFFDGSGCTEITSRCECAADCEAIFGSMRDCEAAYGHCEAPGCRDSGDCLETEFCDFATVGTWCGTVGSAGVCAERPRGCVPVSAEFSGGFCGCDGASYRTRCLATLSGADILHLGPCGVTSRPVRDCRQNGCETDRECLLCGDVYRCGPRGGPCEELTNLRNIDVLSQGSRTPQLRHTVLCAATGLSCTVEGSIPESPRSCSLSCPAGSELAHCCSVGDDPCGGAAVTDRGDASMWQAGVGIRGYSVRGATSTCLGLEVGLTGATLTESLCDSTVGRTNAVARCRSAAGL